MWFSKANTYLINWLVYIGVTKRFSFEVSVRNSSLLKARMDIEIVFDRESYVKLFLLKLYRISCLYYCTFILDCNHCQGLLLSTDLCLLHFLALLWKLIQFQASMSSLFFVIFFSFFFGIERLLSSLLSLKFFYNLSKQENSISNPTLFNSFFVLKPKKNKKNKVKGKQRSCHNQFKLATIYPPIRQFFWILPVCSAP